MGALSKHQRIGEKPLRGNRQRAAASYVRASAALVTKSTVKGRDKISVRFQVKLSVEYEAGEEPLATRVL